MTSRHSRHGNHVAAGASTHERAGDGLRSVPGRAGQRHHAPRAGTRRGSPSRPARGTRRLRHPGDRMDRGAAAPGCPPRRHGSRSRSPLRRVLARARLRGRNTGERCVHAAAGRFRFPAAGCGAARGQYGPSHCEPARASPRGQAAAAWHPRVRLARRRRLSVQCVVVSLAAARQASARPPRRLHSYPCRPRPAGRSQPRAQRRLSAFVGPGAGRKPREFSRLASAGRCHSRGQCISASNT